MCVRELCVLGPDRANGSIVTRSRDAMAFLMPEVNGRDFPRASVGALGAHTCVPATVAGVAWWVTLCGEPSATSTTTTTTTAMIQRKTAVFVLISIFPPRCCCWCCCIWWWCWVGHCYGCTCPGRNAGTDGIPTSDEDVFSGTSPYRRHRSCLRHHRHRARDRPTSTHTPFFLVKRRGREEPGKCWPENRNPPAERISDGK